jgi:myosin heavy subunit
VFHLFWQARLAESEAKLRHTVRAREKAQLLEEEVDLLKQRLTQTEADCNAFVELKEENKALQESLVSLQQSGGKDLLQAIYQSSLDEVNSLADAQAEIVKFSRGPGMGKTGLQEYIAGLENKIVDMEKQLAEANTNSAELAGRSDNSSLSSAGGNTEDQSLHRQVRTKVLTVLF